MSFDADSIALLLLFAAAMCLGVYLCLRPQRVAAHFAAEQERRGRKFLAQYERSWINRMTIRFIGLMLICGPGAAAFFMLRHALTP
ncbi:MAG: hypothetical protein ACXU8U_07110 [Asticcacaulis sp.]